MKKIRFLVLLTLILAVFTVPPVAAKPGDGQERVIVYFQPGKMNEVRGALLTAKGQIHIAFEKYNAFAVTLPVSALNGITRNPNITLVELDAVREPSSVAVESLIEPQMEPYGVEMVQAPQMWKKGYTGEGVVVCVIDTGLYTEHEDLVGANVLGGQAITGFDWQYDGDGHGTHVAGTIAAQDNKFGVIGVSPDASLYIYKIFGDDGLWVKGSKTTASNLVVAADTCAANGANIISMSLGGARPTKLEERAFEGYYAAGILSVAAAGNENDPADSTTWGVLHYPASYPSVISVAAVDENAVVADFSQRNETLELSAPGVDVWSSISYIETNLVSVGGVDYVANHIEYTPYGTISGALADGGRCLTPGEWVGKVVLCERGDATFADKVMNVEASGGVSAVIYNNEPGNFLGTMGEEDLTGIIAVSLSQEDGQYLVANALNTGASVLSEVEKPASGYEPWGGTSMATPHVSAVAALLWAYCPSATNAEIRQAMIDSASDLGDAGFDTDYGYGLVQAFDAKNALKCGAQHDELPPVISNISTALKGKTRWTITYTTDELALCSITLDNAVYPEVEFLLDHILTVNTSAPLVFSIVCEDEAGNLSDPFFYP